MFSSLNKKNTKPVIPSISRCIAITIFTGLMGISCSSSPDSPRPKTDSAVITTSTLTDTTTTANVPASISNVELSKVFVTKDEFYTLLSKPGDKLLFNPLITKEGYLSMILRIKQGNDFKDSIILKRLGKSSLDVNGKDVSLSLLHIKNKRALKDSIDKYTRDMANPILVFSPYMDESENLGYLNYSITPIDINKIIPGFTDQPLIHPTDKQLQTIDSTLKALATATLTKVLNPSPPARST